MERLDSSEQYHTVIRNIRYERTMPQLWKERLDEEKNAYALKGKIRIR